MKKITPKIVTILILVLIILIIGTVKIVEVQGSNISNKVEDEKDINFEDISKKLIRFHVIANSDGQADQTLKLKIRDEVLKYIQPILKESESIEESREILNENNDEIINITEKVIIENGYDYKVDTTLSKEYFPVKSYGNITLPQGEYEAYRIIIGNGEGQNWWCVMFPPICFVDITKGEVAYEETEKEMKDVLNEKEFNMIDNTKKEEDKKNNKTANNEVKVVDSTEDNNIVVKFKVAELFKGLFK